MSLYAARAFMKRPSFGGPTMVSELLLTAAASAMVITVPGMPEQVWKATRVRSNPVILEIRTCNRVGTGRKCMEDFVRVPFNDEGF
jgi:hypothetical protein